MNSNCRALSSPVNEAPQRDSCANHQRWHTSLGTQHELGQVQLKFSFSDNTLKARLTTTPVFVIAANKEGSSSSCKRLCDVSVTPCDFKSQSFAKQPISPSQSEEDLLLRSEMGTSAPIRSHGKSDSLSDLSPASGSGEGCGWFANTLVLLARSTSAPALTDPTPAERPCKRVTFGHVSFCGPTPTIVIDEPSDDEKEENCGGEYCTSDCDLQSEQYYACQEVLSDWEEILQDLRVTEL